MPESYEFDSQNETLTNGNGQNGGIRVADRIGQDGVDAGGFASDVWRRREDLEVQRVSTEARLGSLVDNFTYNMRRPNRGHFVVFNHSTFDKATGMGNRPGTEKDVTALEEAASHIAFKQITVYNNLTKKDLFETTKMYSKTNHTDNDCFICVILTHGEENDTLFARDKKYSLKKITKMFRADKCPSLAGKPKLFFIQACRGNTFDEGAGVDVVDSIPQGAEELEPLQRIPVEADFLFGHSTCEDYYSWRNKANGSVFIQNLCNSMLEYGLHMEIMQILTRVNRKVAFEFESKTNQARCNNKKQMPSITTRLTADLYFTINKGITTV